jgi:hypothetical protein
VERDGYDPPRAPADRREGAAWCDDHPRVPQRSNSTPAQGEPRRRRSAALATDSPSDREPQCAHNGGKIPTRTFVASPYAAVGYGKKHARAVMRIMRARNRFTDFNLSMSIARRAGSEG